MLKISLSAKRKQLKLYSSQLESELGLCTGSLTERAQLLIRRIRTLILELRFSLSSREIRRILGATTVFLGLALNQNAQAQSFAPPQNNPFSITQNAIMSIPAFADLDADGDFDMLANDILKTGASTHVATLKYFENTGSSASPQFASPVDSAFGLKTDSVHGYWVIPSFGDLDGDGDYDLMTGGSSYGLYYFENIGAATGPAFAAPVTNPFGLTDTLYYGAPVMVDIDADGDLDILASENLHHFVFYENHGTATQPNFGAKQYKAYVPDSSYLAYPAVGDVDGDGDFDLVLGSYYADLYYFENTGTAQIPNFATGVVNPSGLQRSTQILFPALADLDGDADPDLVVGDLYGTFTYYENLRSLVGLTERTFEVEVYPTLVDDYINISTPETLSAIRVTEMNGSVIRVSKHQNLIHLDYLSRGTYLLQLTNEHGDLVVKKFTKQ